jgi:hypothetical protein
VNWKHILTTAAIAVAADAVIKKVWPGNPLGL